MKFSGAFPVCLSRNVWWLLRVLRICDPVLQYFSGGAAKPVSFDLAFRRACAGRFPCPQPRLIESAAAIAKSLRELWILSATRGTFSAPRAEGTVSSVTWLPRLF